jgi:hypothetical protein
LNAALYSLGYRSVGGRNALESRLLAAFPNCVGLNLREWSLQTLEAGRAEWTGSLGDFIAQTGIDMGSSPPSSISFIEFYPNADLDHKFRLVVHSQDNGFDIEDRVSGPESLVKLRNFVSFGSYFAGVLGLPSPVPQGTPSQDSALACSKLVIDNWSMFIRACRSGLLDDFRFKILERNDNEDQ